MITPFEGSYLGHAERLPADAVMECKICWHVYDPANGCEAWQVPPGTAFAALPSHWRCPVCDAAPEQFMVLSGSPASAAPHPPDPAADFATRLEASFREIHAGRMRGMPLVNAALGVKAVGFHTRAGRVLGVLITPWFMNLVVAAAPDSGAPAGTKQKLAFPSGTYEFTGVNRPELPSYLACSLFSPMFEFTTMLQAIETARAVLVSLFDASLNPDPPQPGPPARPEAVPPPGRRALLLGVGGSAQPP